MLQLPVVLNLKSPILRVELKRPNIQLKVNNGDGITIIIMLNIK